MGIGYFLLAGSSTTFTPGAFDRIARASAGVIGRSNSMFTASLWARYTGTRTQVALIFKPG